MNNELSISDEIINSIPFLKYLKDRGQKKSHDKPYIQYPLEFYSEFNNVYGIFPSEFPNDIPIATYNLARINKVTTIGSIHKVNPIIKKIEETNSISEIKHTINSSLFRGHGHFLGLDTFINIFPKQGVVGGIDRNTQVWWRNEVLKLNHIGIYLIDLLHNMHILYRKCIDSKDKIDVIVCHPIIYEWIKLKLNMTLSGINNEPNPHICNTYFKWEYGNLYFIDALILKDDYCPEEKMYFINSNYFEWRYITDFYMTPWVMVEKAMYKSCLLFEGGLFASKLHVHGLLDLPKPPSWWTIIKYMFPTFYDFEIYCKNNGLGAYVDKLYGKGY